MIVRWRTLQQRLFIPTSLDKTNYNTDSSGDNMSSVIIMERGHKASSDGLMVMLDDEYSPASGRSLIFLPIISMSS